MKYFPDQKHRCSRLLPPQKSITAVGGVCAVASFMTYSNDTTQLQFDAATSVGSLLALLDAEKAHRFGMWAAKSRLVPRDSRPDPPSLATTVWGRHFVNPLGESGWLIAQAL